MVALAFLKTPASSSGEAEVDVSAVLNVLRDAEQQYMHDDAYDSLDLLNSQYSQDLPLLTQTLQDTTADFTARWYALHAISKIEGHTRDFALLASSLLLDKDQYLRILAMDGIRNCDPPDSIVAVPYLVQAIKDPHTKVSVRMYAVPVLIKILGLGGAFKALQRGK